MPTPEFQSISLSFGETGICFAPSPLDPPCIWPLGIEANPNRLTVRSISAIRKRRYRKIIDQSEPAELRDTPR